MPDILIFVHYFGKCAKSRQLIDFSLDNGAWLIEDAAHCLLPEGNIGNSGDFVIYSPHKLLPIPDGGLLIIRPDGPSNILRDPLEVSNFQELYHSILTDSDRYDISTYTWVVKRVLQKFWIRIDKQVEFGGVEEDSPHRLPVPRMSKLAARLLNNFVFSLNNDSVKRIENQEVWSSCLTKVGILGRNAMLPDASYTPYLARFSFTSSDQAELFFALLIESNIPVTTWPDLPPEVIRNPEKHKSAIKMRNTFLYLPVHCSISRDKVIYYTDRISKKDNYFVRY